MIRLRVLDPNHPSDDDVRALLNLNAQFNDITLTPLQLADNLRSTGEQVILAELDGCAVGFACVQILRQVCYDTPTAEVTELFVTSNARRHGVGRALMLQAEDIARKAGARVMKLATGFNNLIAQRLYRQLGYENDDIVLDKRLFDDGNNRATSA